MIGGLDLGADTKVNEASVAEETFNKLATRFSYDAKIAERMVKLGFRSPAELSKVPRDKLQQLFVGPCNLGEKTEVNLARLILALERVDKAIKTVEVLSRLPLLFRVPKTKNVLLLSRTWPEVHAIWFQFEFRL